MWVDGLQNQVYLRIKAIPELSRFLDGIDISSDVEDLVNVMSEYFGEIIDLHDQFKIFGGFESDEDNINWNHIQRNMLYDDDSRHIPIPVYSYIKPTMGPRFIHHIMLSLGEFHTEVDLILHRKLRESLRY